MSVYADLGGGIPKGPEPSEYGGRSINIRTREVRIDTSVDNPVTSLLPGPEHIDRGQKWIMIIREQLGVAATKQQIKAQPDTLTPPPPPVRWSPR